MFSKWEYSTNCWLRPTIKICIRRSLRRKQILGPYKNQCMTIYFRWRAFIWRMVKECNLLPTIKPVNHGQFRPNVHSGAKWYTKDSHKANTQSGCICIKRMWSFKKNQVKTNDTLECSRVLCLPLMHISSFLFIYRNCIDHWKSSQ